MRQRYPYDPDESRGVPAVIRTGRLEFLREVTPEYVNAALDAVDADEARRGDVLDLLDKLQLTSVITVPLNTNRRTIGAMQFVSAESGRIYDHEDVALAQAAAGRIAEALDNVWLTEQHRSIASKLQAALLPPRLPQCRRADDRRAVLGRRRGVRGRRRLLRRCSPSTTVGGRSSSAMCAAPAPMPPRSRRSRGTRSEPRRPTGQIPLRCSRG